MAAGKRSEGAKGLDLADAVAVNLNGMIGVGVFVALGIGADLAGPGLLLAIFLAGAVTTCAAVAPPSRFAGVAQQRVEQAGAWLALMAGIPAAAAAAGMLIAYIAPAAPLLIQRGAMVGVIVVTGLIAAGGYRASVRADGVFLALKVGALAFLMGLALPLVDRANFRTPVTNGAVGVWQAAALMVFAFNGFQRASNASRNAPRGGAAVVSILVAGALYMLVAFAAIGLTGPLFSATNLAGRPFNGSLLIPASFTNLPLAARAVVSLGAIAAAVSLLYILLGDARRAIPAWLAAPNPEMRRPVLFAGILAIVMGTAFTSHALIAFSAFATLLGFALRIGSARRLATTVVAVAVLSLTPALPPRVVVWGAIVAAAGVLVAFRAARPASASARP